MKLSEQIRYTTHAQDACRGRCHIERGEIADEVALLEAKLKAIPCGSCDKNLLECKCDDLEDG